MAGIELDLFSVFAILMFLGIGVDYGIHLVHPTLGTNGMSMSEALSLVGPALLLAGATTVVGFGTLMWSAYGPLRSLGFVSVATISSALVASLLVLPALVVVGSDRMKVCALVPVFNEVRTIADVVRGAAASWRRPRRGRRIHRRHGGGAAATGAQVMRLDHNGGKGTAIRAGLSRVLQGDATHVLFMDGDLQHRPDEIPGLWTVAAHWCRDGHRRAYLRPRGDAGVALLGQRDRQLGARDADGRGPDGHAVRLPCGAQRRLASDCRSKPRDTSSKPSWW